MRFAPQAARPPDPFDTKRLRVELTLTAWAARCRWPPMAAQALLFPGQGSHTEGMDEPHRGAPLFVHGLELLGFDPFDDLAEGTRTQQPALFILRGGLGRGRPARAVAAAGHSLGEYAALVAAGALEFEDAVRLVDARADAMARARRSGRRAAWSRCSAGTPTAVQALPRTTRPHGRQRQRARPARALGPARRVRRRRRRARRGRRPRAPARRRRRVPLAADGAGRRPRWRRALADTPVARVRASRSTPTAPPRRSGTSARSWPRTCCGPCAGARRCSPCARSASSASSSSGPAAVLTGMVKRTLRAAPA